VLKEKGFSREDLMSPHRALQLQQHILDAQLQAEISVKADEPSGWYICDRSGLDPIVYAQVLVGSSAAENMLASDAWQKLEHKMKSGVVVLCEAGCTWLVDDGVRLMPRELDEWMRVDAAFRELLRARGIPFTVISKDVISMPERVKKVQEAIRFGCSNGQEGPQPGQTGLSTRANGGGQCAADASETVLKGNECHAEPCP
jgi:hypothetical protein